MVHTNFTADSFQRKSIISLTLSPNVGYFLRTAIKRFNSNNKHCGADAKVLAHNTPKDFNLICSAWLVSIVERRHHRIDQCLAKP